jgi:cytoskeletal protein CcmA (bactofilin family)
MNAVAATYPSTAFGGDSNAVPALTQVVTKVHAPVPSPMASDHHNGGVSNVDLGLAFMEASLKILKVDEAIDNIRTVIAEGDVFEGNLTTKGGVRVTGSVTGNVTSLSGSVVVDAQGVIDGNVSATNRVICDGRIGSLDKTKPSQATVVCEGVVALTSKAKMRADVYSGQFVNYQGSTINGMLAPFSDFKKG